MQRPTLADFRFRWPAEAMGICQADSQVIACCNDAQERLMMDPLAPEEGWWGSWVTMNLSATVSCGSTYVTVPREIARLVVMGVCQKPIRIRNGFYEYLQFSPGLQPKTCSSGACGQVFQAYDRDTVVTLAPLAATSTIRVYPTDNRDTGLRVLVQGKDANGVVVLNTDPGSGQSGLGEYLQLGFPFVDSVNQFSTITGLLKDQTFGPVTIVAVNPTTGVETALSSMEPTEFAANYRRYLIAGIPTVTQCCSGAGTIQIQAQGRLDFIPCQNETDFLLIQNVPALVEEAMSIRHGRMDGGAELSALHHGKALALLNGQLDLYVGKNSTAVRVPIFGSDRMRRQPV